MAEYFLISYDTFHPPVLADKHVVKSSSGNYTLTADDLPTPVLKGFSFDAWYYEDTLDHVARVGDVITEDTRLYARWIETDVSITTGLGNKKFQLKSFWSFDYLSALIDDRGAFLVDESGYLLCDAEGDPLNATVMLLNPTDSEFLKFVAANIITAEHFSAKDLFDKVDEKAERFVNFINVHNNAY